MEINEQGSAIMKICYRTVDTAVDMAIDASKITPFSGNQKQHVPVKLEIKSEHNDDNTPITRKIGVRRYNFRCKYCWVSTTTKPALDIHMQLHTQGQDVPKKYGVFRFRCDKCPSYGVYRRSHVERHAKHHELLESKNWGEMNVENGVEFFSCNFCNYQTRRIFNLVKHVPCCKVFKSNKKKKKVAIQAIKPKKSAVKQLFGGTAVATSKKLVERSKKMMTGKNQYANPRKNTISNIDKMSAEQITQKFLVLGSTKRHKCKFCGYESDNLGHVIRHMPVHRANAHKWPYKCTHCSASFNIKGILVSHMKVHQVEPLRDSYACDHCDKVYSTKAGRHKHMTVHHGEYIKKRVAKLKIKVKTPNKLLGLKKKEEECTLQIKTEPAVPVQEAPLILDTFNCAQCNYVAQTMVLLKIHVREFHSPQKSLHCAHCSYSTIETSDLASHNDMMHGSKLNVNSTDMMQCVLCSFTTVEHSALTAHLKEHINGKPYKCEECHYTTLDGRDLLEHSKIHIKENTFKCLSCPFETAWKPDLEAHLVGHSAQKAYSCPYCEYSVSTTRNLEIHMRLHIKVEPFRCELCDFVSGNAKTFEWHMRCHTDDSLFKCDCCESYFQKKSSLLLHMKMHRLNTVQETDVTIISIPPSTLLNEDMKVCDLCDFQTKGSLIMAQHRRNEHSDALPFKCNMCVYSASKLTNFRQHIRRYHMDHSTQYKCEQCDFVAIQRSDLVVHGRKHSGLKPYKCDQCDYETARKSLLTQHFRQHSGARPYVCNMCPFATATYNNLMRHRRCHSGEKPYQCKECDFSTSQKSHLMRHMRVHFSSKPFACDKCAFQTAHPSELKRHESQHNFEKKHKCPLCCYSSNKQYAINRHVRSCHGDCNVESQTRPSWGEDVPQPLEHLKPVSKLSLTDNMLSTVLEPEYPTFDTMLADSGIDTPSMHICQFCGRKFTNQEDCNHHARRHFMQWPEAHDPAQLLAQIQASVEEEVGQKITQIL
uniref:Zinc finger protein 91-like n=1 Tax=Saccoglossus kowalevskii TaxID=10224 RepID=A0ABM0MX80_SACKO|nr:PREDICTED: zinc finger protein 91-like [Saccoglossus kowalevskii]